MSPDTLAPPVMFPRGPCARLRFASIPNCHGRFLRPRGAVDLQCPAIGTASERRAAHGRRSLDNDEAGSLQTSTSVRPFGHQPHPARNIGHSDRRAIPDERRLWVSRYARNFKYSRNFKWLTLHISTRISYCSIVDEYIRLKVSSTLSDRSATSPECSFWRKHMTLAFRTPPRQPASSCSWSPRDSRSAMSAVCRRARSVGE